MKLSPRLTPVSLAVVMAMTSTVSKADDESSDVSLEDLFQLEVITVTARKRTENMREVPVSITAFQTEKLDAASSAGMDIRFLNARIPSLSVESSFGRTFPRFYVRGLGNTDFDLNGSQPVSLVFDEVVLENPILKGFPTFDVSRIEVLRGPQGTLFGRNTPAGLVKFESRKPTQDLDGYASLSSGTNGNMDFEAAIGNGISENWSARFSMMYQEKDHFIDNLAPGMEKKGVLGGYEEKAARIQLLYDNDNNFTALFNYHVRDLDGSPIPFRGNVIQPGSNKLVDSFEDDQVFQDAAHLATQKVDSKGFTMKLEYTTEEHTFTSVSGYESTEIFSRADIDGGYGAPWMPEMGPGLIIFDAQSADGIPDHEQLTQELRISSNELGKYDYQVGMFFFSEDVVIDSYSFSTVGGNVENGYARQNQVTDAWAIFGTLDVEMSDKFKVTTGLRYSADEKDFVAERLTNPTPWNGSPDYVKGTANPDDSHVSWDISTTYEWKDGHNFYTRIADGFRAPSIQGRILFGDVVTVADSETVLSFEAGVKADIMEGKGRVSGSVYYYRMNDQQLTAVGGDANFNRLINADNTIGKGFEVDLEVAVTSDFMVTGSLSYNNTELSDETIAVAVCAQCTVLDPLNGDGQAILDGNRLPHAPEWIMNFTARYTKELGEGEFFMFTDWSYRSDINFFLYESAEFTGAALLEGGMRLGYNWDSGDNSYEVALFSRNITDKRVAIGAIDFNNLTGMVNEERFVGAEFKVSFY